MYYLFSQNKFKLCDGCIHKITKRTFQHPDVIRTLGEVGPGFCEYMPDSIIPKPMRQKIRSTVTNDQALGLIRDVCLSDVDFRFLKNNISL